MSKVFKKNNLVKMKIFNTWNQNETNDIRHRVMTVNSRLAQRTAKK
jgi:hypothetical protein